VTGLAAAALADGPAAALADGAAAIADRTLAERYRGPCPRRA
jgi:hypothetical protein